MGIPNVKALELIVLSLLAKRTLARKPEPEAVTDQSQSVKDYNRVMETNLTANYAVGLDLIYRTGVKTHGAKALDLCSGPGYFALCLAKYLNYSSVKGVDLSLPMVDSANKNSKQWNLSNRAQFFRENVLHINEFSKYDVITFTNAAHHMPDVRVIKQILEKAQSLVKDTGLILLTDLARLKTSKLTEKFVRYAGREFIEKNMPAMYEDFHNSMYAAFSPEELSAAIPSHSDRLWVHIIPRGLTCFQALIGLPVGETSVFKRDSAQWATSDIHSSPDSISDWKVLKNVVNNAEIVLYHPSTNISKAAA